MTDAHVPITQAIHSYSVYCRHTATIVCGKYKSGKSGGEKIISVYNWNLIRAYPFGHTSLICSEEC